MPASPDVAILHSVHASRSHDPVETRHAIHREIDVDVRIARTPPESDDLLADADVAICSGVSPDQLDRADELEWVHAVSSGVDGYPIDAIRERGIVLTNTSGPTAEPIAIQAIGYVLVFARRIHRGIRQQAEGRWQRYGGDEVRGATLGLIGVGAVGTRVAELGQELGMRVVGVKANPDDAPGSVDETVGPDRLFDVLPEVDYLVVACPLTDETRGMVGRAELDALADDAVLVNVARGGIVDYDALTEALQQGSIGGAALDVFPEEPFDLDSPLWDLPNVVITPHMAGSTPRKAELVARVFADNYRAFVDGEREGMPTRVV